MSTTWYAHVGYDFPGTARLQLVHSQAFIMNSDERREATLRRGRELRVAESSEERETRLARRRMLHNNTDCCCVFLKLHGESIYT